MTYIIKLKTGIFLPAVLVPDSAQRFFSDAKKMAIYFTGNWLASTGKCSENTGTFIRRWLAKHQHTFFIKIQVIFKEMTGYGIELGVAAVKIRRAA